MEFKECEISGQLVAEGERGQYWVDSGAWTYVDIVTVDSAGPNIKQIGCFASIEDANDYIKEYDKGEGE